jgi:hypothetical protein
MEAMTGRVHITYSRLDWPGEIQVVSGPGSTHCQNGIGLVSTLRWSLEVNR